MGEGGIEWELTCTQASNGSIDPESGARSLVPKTWRKGIVVDAFGSLTDEVASKPGYLSTAKFKEMQKHPECPWHLDEPYWVRMIPGEEFVDIVNMKRWQQLQDGDFADTECSPELCAVAALVARLLSADVRVRVWCWHSQ
jgi:hypothetical protein